MGDRTPEQKAIDVKRWPKWERLPLQSIKNDAEKGRGSNDKIQSRFRYLKHAEDLEKASEAEVRDETLRLARQANVTAGRATQWTGIAAGISFVMLLATILTIVLAFLPTPEK